MLFPLHERLKGHHSVALRRELEGSQWWSREKVEALQLQRLREFLVRAQQNVPFYRETFLRVGFKPGDLASASELQRLPLLTKAEIRSNTDAMKSSLSGPLIRYSTGGSSGEPLVFYMGMGRISHDVAAKWRATRWWDVDIGDPEVALWGSPIEIGKQDMVKTLRDRLFRSHLLPAFQMSQPQMDRFLDRLEQVRPKMLFGYASALALLAGHAESRHRDLSGIGAKVVFATGETLYESQREIIERVFRAPVANGYGSRDAGFIAHQCPSGSLHVSAEHIVVELVDAAGNAVSPGQTGEIVVTHMATDDFPFVRYRTGDIATMSVTSCRCGRGLPILDQVLGRNTDFIQTRSGNAMHALGLIYEVRDKPGVRAFKFIQSEDLSLELLLVPDSAFSKDVETEIRHCVLARMGAGADFVIRRVDAIPPERSGKYRYVVSKASPAIPGRPGAE